MSLYLLLNILTFGTFLLSFDKKVHFYSYFKFLSIGITINMLLFIPWDIWFTHKSYWGFNPTYLIGLDIFNLPIEEWLFFITVPFSCVFIHYVLKAYFKNPIQLKFSKSFWKYISIIIFIIGILSYKKMYTFVTLPIAAIVIYYINKKYPDFTQQFTFTYIIALIPFIIVNGILTGGITPEPIVWYNDEENFGIRFLTIPIEDFIYNLLLLVIPTFTTNFLNEKQTR